MGREGGMKRGKEMRRKRRTRGNERERDRDGKSG